MLAIRVSKNVGIGRRMWPGARYPARRPPGLAACASLMQRWASAPRPRAGKPAAAGGQKRQRAMATVRPSGSRAVTRSVAVKFSRSVPTAIEDGALLPAACDQDDPPL